MHFDIIRAETHSEITPEIIEKAKGQIEARGWAFLRGFDVDMDKFSKLVGEFCNHITFDPAREYTAENTQKVDAGTGPIGLHIENGNTPIRPDLVAFYAERAAFSGSQTTICDGAEIFANMSPEDQKKWQQPITVTRNLPEQLWKRYLANEHPALNDPSEVKIEHMEAFKSMIPGQDYELLEDGSVNYSLTIEPVIASKYSGALSFANAILGPSHNYEKPVYTWPNGDVLTDEEIEELRDFAEKFTVEINWNDGDIALIDNTRVQHGRRAIIDENRNLFIGMGRV